jgi:hypothetical protein
MAEFTEMSAREWRSTLPFSTKWAIRPYKLFGQMGFGQTGFRPNEVGSLKAEKTGQMTRMAEVRKFGQKFQ